MKYLRNENRVSTELCGTARNNHSGEVTNTVEEKLFC